MKLSASLLLLVFMGCASKPNSDAFDYDPTYGKRLEQSMNSGEAKHVTRSQWEAAQGLYHSSLACNEDQYWKMITERGQLPPGEYFKGIEPNTFWYCEHDPVGDTFPPSGDAK